MTGVLVFECLSVWVFEYLGKVTRRLQNHLITSSPIWHWAEPPGRR
jgi:hypothetical protein